jgi:hypothetical protein
MKFYKKIFITVIIIISTYILFRLLYKRDEIIQSLKQQNKIQKNTNYETNLINEEFTGLNIFSSVNGELQSAMNKNPVHVQNCNDNYLTQPLRQFCIKASYNTAVTGNYVNLDMIKYVLSTGCRYLDFEVFLIDEVPQVSYTTDPKYNTIDTDNTLPLDTVFSKIMSNAFTITSPNSNDPLFINLRIKSFDNLIYNKIATSIDSNLKGKLYDGKVSKNTSLSQLMNKIVLIVDRTINPNYANLSSCSSSNSNCLKLINYVNMESGTSDLFQQRYTELMNQCSIEINILLDQCNICTDIKNMRVLLPDLNMKNGKNKTLTKES